MSKVFMMDLRSRGTSSNKQAKIKKLLEAAGSGLFHKDDLIAVKTHFGEQGNDGFIRPIYLRSGVDWLREEKTKPFLTDTNTLYSGKRAHAVDHEETAASHGFVPIVINAPIVIADGLRGENEIEISIDGKHFQTVRIAGAIAQADGMVVFSHFKGHQMAGFGGAIKNLAMGCATPAGKRDQHATRQKVIESKCVACGTCQTVCPVNAIEIGETAFIDSAVCIGCGECMTVCPTDAIGLNWDTEIPEFNERMVEYAYGAVKDKPVVYVNFVLQVAPDCDCAPWSDAPIVGDIGILASTDPVALDRACLDLVNQQEINPASCLAHEHADSEFLMANQRDLFKAVHPNTRGEIQLSYGETIGLGSQKYEIEVLK
ncbi:DUF362 domain-containing protein [Gottschalkiaceae bacterium SANA]|nr:DUF362 domain-containing protein [Gottschalkiaceae bacterium SANA]